LNTGSKDSGNQKGSIGHFSFRHKQLPIPLLLRGNAGAECGMANRVRSLGTLFGIASLCIAFSAETPAPAPLADVPPAQLDAFMQKWQTYKPSEGPRADIDIPFLLAALKKDPKGPWAGYIATKAMLTHSEARRALGEARTNLFRKTLSYLAPARAIVADALATNPKLQYNHDHLLGLMAAAALESGSELGEVKGAAQEMLANNTDTKSWNYGNVTYSANELLGRVALREGDLDAAKKYLLTAGKTKGSPQLNSFGPNFTLARELAEKGERDTVIEFLDLVGLFWANPDKAKEGNARNVATDNRKQLDAWKQQIQDGKIPTDQKWR
jgi:hypothetical protein